MRYFYYVDQAEMLYYSRYDFEEITKNLETFKKHMAIYPVEGEMLERFEVCEECEQLLGDLPKIVSHKNIYLYKEVADGLLRLKKQTYWTDKIEYVMTENGKDDFKNMDEALDAFRKYLIKCHKNDSRIGPQTPLKEQLARIKKNIVRLK